eukprot:NODE_13_length_42895_cov_0.518413.p8 type:complete len:558 gc:universal NODE_13_length_42895_cov_0.518413:33547-31874(-)
MSNSPAFPTTGLHIYSHTGYDIMSLLARTYYRKNPTISLGPVDMSCSFCITDNTKPDCPIVYVSHAFEELTGYTAAECVGQNCRFLQSVSTEPDGLVTLGSRRRYTDNNVVYQMKKDIDALSEGQHSLINYKKGGEPFLSFISIIPISSTDDGPLDLFIGFQVSLIEQPYNVMKSMKDGIYVMNYQLDKSNLIESPQEVVVAEEEKYRFGKMDDTDTLKPYIAEMMSAEPDQDLKSEFYQILTQNIPYLFCLSVKGQFIHINDACLQLFEYSSSEILNKNLSEFCHSGDWVGIMREFKSLPHMADQPINMIFRFNRKMSGYTWLGVQGKCNLMTNLGMICERPKGKRLMVLTAREQYLPTLNFADLDSFGGFGESSLWSKITAKGIFLVNTPRKATEELFGMRSYQLFGKCLLDFVHDEDYENVRFGLNGVLEGKICYMFYRIRYKTEFKWVESVFFPGGFYYPVNIANELNSPSRGFTPIVAYIFHKMTPVKSPPHKLDVQFFGVRPVLSSELEDVFSAFNPNKETSWQYELHILKTEHRNILESLGIPINYKDHT